jgi:uncharacterized delta-60 repeat protein
VGFLVRFRPRSAFLALAIGATLLMPPAASAAPGDLDPTFSGNGIAITAFPSSFESRSFAAAEAVVKDHDGGLVVTGYAGPYDASGPNDADDFAFARYRRNGELDPSFGDQGRQVVDIGNADEATDLARLPHGRLVAVGRSGAPLADRSPDRRGAKKVAVVVLTRDGEPDPSFGDGGSVVVRLHLSGRPTAMAVQPNGRIVIGGWMAGDFFVMRLRANGELDRSFAGDGTRRLDFDRPGLRFSDDLLTDLAIDDRGRIAVSGTANQRSTHRPKFDPDFAIARLKPSGHLDRSFSRDGRRTLNVRRGQHAETENDFDQAAALVAQPNDALVVAGTVFPRSRGTPGNPDVAVARVDRRGRLDPRFANDGTRTTNIKGDDKGTDIALRSDSRIVVTAEGYSSRRVAALRYTGRGHLDRSFSGNGIAVLKIDHRLPSGSVALGPHQKVVIAGTAGLVEDYGFYVARFSRHGAR